MSRNGGAAIKTNGGPRGDVSCGGAGAILSCEAAPPFGELGAVLGAYGLKAGFAHRAVRHRWSVLEHGHNWGPRRSGPEAGVKYFKGHAESIRRSGRGVQSRRTLMPKGGPSQ